MRNNLRVILIKKLQSIFFVSLALTAALLFTSCNKKDDDTQQQKKITVITTLFPLYDFAKNVGGDKIDAILLLPPGIEAHEFEPRPTDITRINNAGIFIYTGKFMEPWVNNILKSITNKSLIVVDSSLGVTLLNQSQEFEPEDERQGHGSPSAIDPHIWLDFSNSQKMVDHICDAMIEKDPQDKEFYIKNAADYNLRLSQLDQQFRKTLSHCKYRTIVYGGHFALGYMAKRYDLTFISTYKGFTPDSEPTARNMAELIEKIKKLGVKYLYYEELISPKVATVLADETGTKLLPLYSAHNVSKDEMIKSVGFISIMQQTLENLKVGLECQ
jgi:zinc transport system substrate-binding protein